jgi:hypothetical protein
MEIALPDYLSICILELEQEPRSRGLRSGGLKPQLLQRLLDDDAKPADAQCQSSDFSKGSGNGSDSE